MDLDASGIPAPELTDVDDFQFMQFLHSIAHDTNAEDAACEPPDPTGFAATVPVIPLPAGVPHTMMCVY